MKKVAQASLLASLIISAVHADQVSTIELTAPSTFSSEEHYYQPTVLEDDVLASEVVEDNTSHQTGITAYARAKAQKFANLTKDFTRKHPNVTYAAITTASLVTFASIASYYGEYHLRKHGAKFTLDRTNGLFSLIAQNTKAIAGTISAQNIKTLSKRLGKVFTYAITYPFTKNTSSTDAAPE